MFFLASKGNILFQDLSCKVYLIHDRQNQMTQIWMSEEEPSFFEWFLPIFSEISYCIKVSKKLCNILVMEGTVWQLQKLLLRSWTILEFEMPNSPDILWVLLTRFASESTTLDLPNIAWSLRSLQPKPNWTTWSLLSTELSPLAQWMFLVTSIVLWPNSFLLSINS